jgi:hypothetical protein
MPVLLFVVVDRERMGAGKRKNGSEKLKKRAGCRDGMSR